MAEVGEHLWWLVVCVLVGRKGRGWVEGRSRVFIYVDREIERTYVSSRESCVWGRARQS